MKNILIKIWNIHGGIGKVLTMSCIALFIGALVGTLFGITRCSKRNDVVESNFFLKENVVLHDEEYEIYVDSAYTSDSIEVINKSGETKTKNGNFINIKIVIKQNLDSSLGAHSIDVNDFKLKNHTGVYVPLNDIMGAIGWDAIDIHIDDENGGYVMSSAEFSTIKCIKDYEYIDKQLKPGLKYEFTIHFETNNHLKVEEELMVLEVDLYCGSNKHKKGVDIILLNSPYN